jgi:hypothetical protein
MAIVIGDYMRFLTSKGNEWAAPTEGGSVALNYIVHYDLYFHY